MRILVEARTGLIKYQGYDFEYTPFYTTELSIKGHIEMIDCSLNSDNSFTLDVDEIDDFSGDKYKYVDGKIELNNDWVEPIEEL